jgi:prepilin-type N-terminal cleavage/methylation domain-containing protein
MFKKLPNRLQGFTLIEIIVVLIILGVLAALSIRAYFESIERARITAQVVEVLKSVKTNMEACIMAHEGNPTPILDCGAFLSNFGDSPVTFPAIITAQAKQNNFGAGIWSGSTGDGSTYYYMMWYDTGGGVSRTVTTCGGQPINSSTSSLVLCREPDGSFHIDGSGQFAGYHLSSN